jgi:hypothetical protein
MVISLENGRSPAAAEVMGFRGSMGGFACCITKRFLDSNDI